MDSTLPLAMAVLLVATTVRSAFGFGEALIGVPLLVLAMPTATAVPLAVLASTTVALQIVLQDWRHIHWRSARSLVLATLPGIPLGLMLLRAVPEPIVRTVLGVVIVSFSLYALRHGRGPHLKDDRWAWIFGFFAGVLGGAYGVNGPPLVVYGAMRRWTPERFRATLQAYFLPASFVGLIGYAVTGLWTETVSYTFLWSLPVILFATWLGKLLNRRLHPERFLLYIYLFLIAVGVLLLWEAWRGATPA